LAPRQPPLGAHSLALGRPAALVVHSFHPHRSRMLLHALGAGCADLSLPRAAASSVQSASRHTTNPPVQSSPRCLTKDTVIGQESGEAWAVAPHWASLCSRYRIPMRSVRQSTSLDHRPRLGANSNPPSRHSRGESSMPGAARSGSESQTLGVVMTTHDCVPNQVHERTKYVQRVRWQSIGSR